MDENHTFLDSNKILTSDEFFKIAKVCTTLGVDKIRLTGGEPLLYPNLIELCKKLSSLVNNLCLTTNANYLKQKAHLLKDAGVKHINISLDTLDKDKYCYITKGGVLQDVLDGIDEALSLNFESVKINTVLINNFNTDEIEKLSSLTLEKNIDVRFIELMPFSTFYPSSSYVGADIVTKKLKNLIPISNNNNSTAKLYKINSNAKGNIGIITPVKSPFCSTCNRIRVTADGYLKPCLLTKDEFYLRHKTDDEIKNIIISALNYKPNEHKNISKKEMCENDTIIIREMNKIGG